MESGHSNHHDTSPTLSYKASPSLNRWTRTRSVRGSDGTRSPVSVMSHDSEYRGVKLEYLVDKRNNIEGPQGPPYPHEIHLPVIDDNCCAAEIPVSNHAMSASSRDGLKSKTMKYSIHSDTEEDDTKKLRNQLADALTGRDKITQELSYSLYENNVIKAQAQEALNRQELEATIRYSEMQSELHEAGDKVLADRMQRQSDAHIVRNLSHDKEIDRQKYINALRCIESSEAIQFEMANKRYEDMKLELENNRANSIHSIEMKAENYHEAFKRDSTDKAKLVESEFENRIQSLENQSRIEREELIKEMQETIKHQESQFEVRMSQLHAQSDMKV